MSANVDTLHDVEDYRLETGQKGWRRFFQRERASSAKPAAQHTEESKQSQISEKQPGKYLSDWWLEM